MPEFSQIPQAIPDKIPNAIAPAGQGGPTAGQMGAKLDFIKEQYAPIREARLKEALEMQPTPEQAEQASKLSTGALEEAKRGDSEAEAKLNNAQRTDDLVSGNRDKLAKALGRSEKRTPQERNTQMVEAQAQLDAARQTADHAKQAEAYARENAQTAKTYSPQYLKNQLEVLVRLLQGIEKEGPLTTSNEMTNALQRLDSTQSCVRLYTEYGLDTDAMKLAPVVGAYERIMRKAGKQAEAVRHLIGKKLRMEGAEIAEATTKPVMGLDGVCERSVLMTDKLDGEYSDHLGTYLITEKTADRGKERAKMLAAEVATMLDVAVDYAIEHKLIAGMTVGEAVGITEATDKPSEAEFTRRMQTMVEAGATVFDGYDKDDQRRKEVMEFAGRVLHNPIVADANDSYIVGAHALDKLFKEMGVSPGVDRVPYILAFGAGMESRYVVGRMEPGVISRNGVIIKRWLADSLPSDKRYSVRKIGEDEWSYKVVKQDGEATPFGLGWSKDRAVEERALLNRPWDNEEGFKRSKEHEVKEQEGWDARLAAQEMLDRVRKKMETRGIIGYNEPQKPPVIGYKDALYCDDEPLLSLSKKQE